MGNGLNLAQMGVSPRANFSCYAMETNVSADLNEPLTIEPGLIALFRTPFRVDEFWTQSLGTLHDEKLADSSLLLMAFSEQASKPELDRRVSALWYALLIQERAYSVNGLKLAGTNTGNGLHIDSGGTLSDFYRSPKVVAEPIELESLRLAASAASGISAIYQRQDGQHYLRLRKGFNAFLRGLQEGTDADFRLHQFVRAVEAVMKPRTGRTKKDFVHRGQLFAGRSPADRNVLEQLFDMRSVSEHLNPLEDLFDQLSGHDRESIIADRVFQSEILAGSIYARLMTDPALLEAFRTEDAIAEFWQKPDDEQIEIWGRAIDLEGEIEHKFGYLSRHRLG